MLKDNIIETNINNNSEYKTDSITNTKTYHIIINVVKIQIIDLIN